MAVARALSAPGVGVGVVPSREALNVVRSWLPPPADGEDDDDLDGAPEPEEAPRPGRCVSHVRGGAHSDLAVTPVCVLPLSRRLGLGAKFLSHQRAQSMFDPVSRRLERQLGGSKARRLRDDGSAAARASAADPGVTSAGRHMRGQQLEQVSSLRPAVLDGMRRRSQHGSQDEEDEEEGRSTAFATKRRPAPAAQLSHKDVKRRRKKGGGVAPS